MAALSYFIAVAAIASVVQSASAANYTVGAPGGSWDLRTNFTLWASTKTFVTGDNLIFNYTSQHNLIEGYKATYDSCSTASPIIMVSTTGYDVVPLTAAGTRYFICGVTGHCGAGMKLAITVVDNATTASSPASSPSSSPPSSTASPAPASSPSSGAPPPPASSPPSSAVSPAPTSPPSSGAPPPTTSAPPPKSGAGYRNLPAKAVGLGLGLLMIFAL